MKDLKNYIVFPLIVAILGAIFVSFINRQVVDVRYTLSQNIPITVSGSTSSEGVQQLEVKNMGNAPAEKIKVDINGKITSYDVVKYSETDKVESFNINNKLQLIYPELPPEGSFKVIFKSEGEGISKDKIVINHNKGKAQEALSKSSSVNSWILLGLLLFYLFIGLLILRGSLVQMVENKARSLSGYMKILKKDEKPFYLKEGEWTDIRRESIDTVIEQNNYVYSYQKLDDNVIYSMLSSDKPDYISDEEWKYFKGKSTDQLKKIIIDKASEFNVELENIIQLLNLKRPKFYDEAKWNDTRKRYLIEKIPLIDNDFINSNKEIEQRISYRLLYEDKPDYLSNEEWENLKLLLMKNLKEIIIQRTSEVGYYKCDDILKYVAIKRPKYYEEVEWNKLIENIVDVYLSMKRYDIFGWTLNIDKIEMELSKVKPKEISIEKWNKHIDFIRTTFCKELERKLYNSDNPINNLKEEILCYFTEEQACTLKNEAYSIQLNKYKYEAWEKGYDNFIKSGKPEWIKDDDYNEIKEFMDDNYKTNQLQKNYETKFKIINKIINNENIGEKIDDISEEDWSILLKLDSDIKGQYQRNMEKEESLNKIMSENSQLKSQTNDLKNKVVHQLSIINDFLTDNAVIDRIEEYDNPFSPGNFENLKKLAKLMKQKDN